MTKMPLTRFAGRVLMFGAGAGAAAYAAYASAVWLGYGQVRTAVGDEQDHWLDRFMPTYDVVERHRIDVAAPAAMAFAAACDLDLRQSAIVRAIFRTRELIMGSTPGETSHAPALVDWAKSLGWGVLAEIPGREIVFGGVAQPWDADVVFRTIPADAFAAFNEPDHVKIVWTLRADPTNEHHAIVRHETRAVATDPGARRKFRRYWSAFAAGITVIRRVALKRVKADAERRARHGDLHARDRFDAVSTGDLDPEC